MFFALFMSALLHAQTYDLVIAHGRVLDPATNLDAVRNIGIRGGQDRGDLRGAACTDATCHRRHGPRRGARASSTCTRTGRRPKTTASRPWTASPRRWRWRWASHRSPPGIAAREGKALINFGATSGHLAGAHGGDARYRHACCRATRRSTRAATPEEQREILDLVRRGLDEGGAGDRHGHRVRAAGQPREMLELFRSPPNARPRSTCTCATAARWSRA